MLWRIKTFLRLVRNTISYISWAHRNCADADWDFSVLLSLIQWKVGRMADNMEKHGVIENNERYARQMRYLVFLLERYMNDDYYYKNMPEYDEDIVEMINRPRTPMEEMVIEESLRRERDAFRRIFRHMERYIERWWW